MTNKARVTRISEGCISTYIGINSSWRCKLSKLSWLMCDIVCTSRGLSTTENEVISIPTVLLKPGNNQYKTLNQISVIEPLQ